MSHFDDLAMEAALLELGFKNMLVAQGKANPERTGLHASSLLQSEGEWCTRREVLHNLFPERALQGEGWMFWDWRRKAIFENGWSLHRRWQLLLKEHADVVWSSESGPGIAYIPSSELERIGKEIDGKIYVPELDLTHYDEERNLYFSPDAILDFGAHRYVVEIKGIKQEEYLQLTDDLMTAITISDTIRKGRLQVQLYMHLLKLSRGVILVENKNNQDFKLWVVESEPSLITTQIERMYQVKRDTILSQRHGVNASFRKCQSSDDPAAQKCPMRAVCFGERE